MKFQPETSEGVNTVTRQEPGRVWVGTQLFEHSLLLPWSAEPQPWGAATLAELGPEHFERILAFKPEVVIFGSGIRLRFVAPGLMRSLIAQRIGVETMDTAAACRTYNVLAAEHRKVLAALLIEPPELPAPAAGNL